MARRPAGRTSDLVVKKYYQNLAATGCLEVGCGYNQTQPLRMAGLFPVIGSLDLTLLAGRLAAFLSRPTGRPFTSDVVIVDGKGTSNWLTHALVRDGGMRVQLNAQLMNSRRVGGWLAAVIAADEVARSKGERPRPLGHAFADHLSGLPTAIYDILAAEEGLPAGLEEWGKFCGDPATDGGAVLWDLSNRVANHFRELLRNDPEWIIKVKADTVVPDRWSVLWSLAEAKLRKGLAERMRMDPSQVMLHEVDVLIRLKHDRAAVKAVCEALPGRISMFSTGDVATTLIQILMQLQGGVEVCLFHLEPSRNYLKHIDARRSAGAAFLDSSKRFFELQQEKLIDLLDKDVGDEPELTTPAGSTLLSSLQHAIRCFEDDTIVHHAYESDHDRSVGIHRCHGIWREAEVLRDQLLKAFEENPQLRQGDVLILSPDPEAYAPALEAVLGQRAVRGPGKDGEIRGFGFTTAGMYGIRRSPVGAMVDALLKLPKGRVTSLDVLNFLSLEAVQSHHGWDESQLEEVEKWFRDAPFNWGLDQDHRKAVVRKGLPQETTDGDPAVLDLGSLKDFLCRLSLGTAFGEEIPEYTIAGQMPLRRVDGQQDMQLAAEVIRILELLQAWIDFAARTGSAGPTTLELTQRKMILDEAGPAAPYGEWGQKLGWLPAFKRVFNALRPQGAAYALECRTLFKSLCGLARRFSEGGAKDREVSYELFLSLMEEHCSFESSAGQFMSGNVTLAPLRSTSVHPAKVIALMGMSDGAFPRRSGGLGPEVYAGVEKVFARRAQECREDTSMHAFLLAVLAAQERLFITFDGYLGADGAPANAAYPVEMLRRALRGLTMGKFSVTGHAIMSYLPVALAKGDTPCAWTFDKDAVSVSRVLGKETFPVLVPKAVPNPEKLTLAEWARFWDSPPREVLRRLGVRVPYQGKVLRVEEPLQVDGPTERLAAEWVKALTDQRRRVDPKASLDLGRVQPLAEHSGMFPPGDAGKDLLSFLLLQENEGEREVVGVIQDFVQTIDDSPESSLEEVPELCSQKRKVFVHPGTKVMAVGVFERMYPDSEVIKWLCVLPRLARERGLDLDKLLVCGLKKAESKGGKVSVPVAGEIPVEKKLCMLTNVDRAHVLEKLESLMRDAASADTPVMPRTMWAGMSEVMEKSVEGKRIRSRATSADLLGGDEFSRADADDQRARVFIPEKFDFDVFNSTLDNLLGADQGGVSGWTYRGSRDTDGFLKPFKAAKAQAKKDQEKQDRAKQREATQALKQKEKDSAAAQKAADKLAGKPSVTKKARTTKKAQDDSAQPDAN